MFTPWVKGKTMVFIDASNIYHSQKRLGWHINLKKLIKLLHVESDLCAVYYYTAYDFCNSKQKRFLDFLEIVGYRVRKKPIKFIRDNNIPNGGYHKGNLDIELTLDAIDTMGRYQTAVIFSGDSDFEPLIQYLKNHKKFCLVVSTKGHIAFELIRQAKFIDLKKFREKLEYKNFHP